MNFHAVEELSFDCSRFHVCPLNAMLYGFPLLALVWLFLSPHIAAFALSAERVQADLDFISRSLVRHSSICAATQTVAQGVEKSMNRVANDRGMFLYSIQIKLILFR